MSGKQNPPRIDYSHPDVVRFVEYMVKQRFVATNNIGVTFKHFNLPYQEWKDSNGKYSGWGLDHRFQMDGVLILQHGYDWIPCSFHEDLGPPQWHKTVGWALNMRWYKKEFKKWMLGIK